MGRSLPIALACLAGVPFLLAVSGKADQAQTPKVFEGEVETILRAHCGSCHTGESARSELDLSTLSGVLKGGSSGKVVVPGDPDKSLLVRRLEGKDDLPSMPLGFKQLSEEKIRAVRAWIKDGCKSAGKAEMHWAYVAPKKPRLPFSSHSKWVRNPIDAFVLEAMKGQGLSPNPEAPKSTLVRRLFLDLTGLPPKPSDVDAFVADTRPDAYERLVDKLLASPHYGERMARPWLDLARYADSDGYEKDLNRTAWKYRDWVIDAFNRNLPYDQFTVEQLAGDMLPQPTVAQLVATGFNRNAMFNSEGGVDPGEAQFNVVLDRVNTTSTVWLGSTMACARCHDHKYDPFSQRDYYRFYAIFANTEVYKLGDYKKGQESWYEATIDVPSSEQAKRKDTLERTIATLKNSLEKPGPATAAKFDKWLASGGTTTVWTAADKSSAVSQAGQQLVPQGDGSLLATGKTPANDVYTVQLAVPGRTVSAVRLEVLPDPSFPNKGPGRASSGNFILSKVEAKSGDKALNIAKVETSFTQSGYEPKLVRSGGGDNGWAIFNAYGQASEMVLTLDQPVKADELTIVLRFDSAQWPEHVLGRFRLSTTSDSSLRVLSNRLRQALADPEKAKKERDSLLLEYQRLDDSIRPQIERLERLQKELQDLKSQIPTAMVMREKPSGKTLANVHLRGEYLQKGEEVAGAPPSILSPKPVPSAYTRLDLAKWLVNPANPLTARVQVNRMWELMFGRGLVETSEDFGTQGSRPSHPELLDWLSLWFVENKWDIKKTLKLIVCSATYRQSSDSTLEKNKKDPKNVWLSRGTRYRMEAEAVRDNMLSIAGLLSNKMGGPSVYPSQPPAIWNTPYNSQQWMPSTGEDKYRRGVYTFWKRSAPYPSFLAMDATSRETCTVRRSRTNTPSQALALLNDEVAMDAARALAKQMKSKGDTNNAIVYGFRACTGRTPSAKEKQILLQLVRDASKRVKGQTAQELPLVLVANTLLNLDETISRN